MDNQTIPSSSPPPEGGVSEGLHSETIICVTSMASLWDWLCLMFPCAVPQIALTCSVSDWQTLVEHGCQVLINESLVVWK